MIAIDLFSGIGGFRLAFEKAGFACVFSSEIDSHARKTYFENFGNEPAGDIRSIPADAIPDHDLLCAGFPCQPFSIAGVSKKNSMGLPHGFNDPKSGNLFFEIARILMAKKPRAILLENVKNLQSHDNGKTFQTIKNILQSLGYTIFHQVINSTKWVPQARERIYIVGFREWELMPDFIKIFSVHLHKNIKLKVLSDILEFHVDQKYTLPGGTWHFLQEYKEKHRKNGNGFGYSLAELNGFTRTLSARYYKDGSEILIPQKNNNPRRLTPRECARLMGFSDNFTLPVSDSQAYKQLGNSVIVPILEIFSLAIAETLKKHSLNCVTC